MQKNGFVILHWLVSDFILLILLYELNLRNKAFQLEKARSLSHFLAHSGAYFLE